MKEPHIYTLYSITPPMNVQHYINTSNCISGYCNDHMLGHKKQLAKGGSELVGGVGLVNNIPNVTPKILS